MRWVLSLFCLLFSMTAATAQERRASHCIALAHQAPGLAYVQLASLREEQLKITYLSHASFLLETAGGLTAITDFTGFTGREVLIPDIVTMNHAHGTHWTANPDPAIPHVLPGWGPFGQGIDHHLDLGEMLVRNVSTDIRSAYGGVEAKGNSIFVFEVAGLCVGHLGHLHHVPTPAQFAALGRLDVVMAPVDGGMTLPIDEMIAVLRQLRSTVIIPMHWFSGYSLERFVTRLDSDFDVRDGEGADIIVSLRSLPDRPTVWVLRPQFQPDFE